MRDYYSGTRTASRMSGAPLPTRFMDLLAQRKERYVQLRMALRRSRERVRESVILGTREPVIRSKACTIDLPADTVTELYKIATLRGMRPKHFLEAMAVRLIHFFTKFPGDPVWYIKRLEDPQEADEVLCADHSVPTCIAKTIDEPEVIFNIFLDSFDSLLRLGIGHEELHAQMLEYQRAFGLARKVGERVNQLRKERREKAAKMRDRALAVKQGSHTPKQNPLNRKMRTVDDTDRIPGEGTNPPLNRDGRGGSTGAQPVENTSGVVSGKNANDSTGPATGHRGYSLGARSGGVPPSEVRKGPGP